MSQLAHPRAPDVQRTLWWIRFWIVVLMFGLVVSGVTAFPLREELSLISDFMHNTAIIDMLPALVAFIDHVESALEVTYTAYPFIAYGTDWLAFAHLLIAVAFIGPLRDPIRNVWVLQWGMIACAGIIPLALIAGAVRGLPIWWQLIDISFAVGGIIPAYAAYWLTRRLERRSLDRAAS